MATITWVEGQPSNGSQVIQAPDFVRGVWEAVATGLDDSLYWPGSGVGSQASIGELRQGAALPFVAATSASSTPANGRGRLFFASDTSRLYVYDSNRTSVVGTPFLVEHATAYTDNSAWVEQAGSFATNTGGTAIAGNTSFSLVYIGVPQVLLFSGNTNHKCQVSTVTAGGFESNVSGPSGSVTYYWNSLGTAVLANV